MINYLLSGALLGLAAGFIPGPLLTLVVAESLQNGTRAGIKVALAPIITDLPIIFLTVFVLGRLAAVNLVMAGISLLGGLVLLFLAWQSFQTRGAVLDPQRVASGSLAKGIMVNLLSPHPYLFWLGVGTPLILQAFAQSLGAAAGFLVVFYTMLVGAKLMLAILTGRSRSFLTGRFYLLVVKGLGLVLVLFALLLFREGWAYLSL